MKYQYSPGLFGYGAKGSDGSAGLQGISFYFTDYDVVFNRSVIELAIQNDYVLWSLSPPNTPMPAGKTYVNGDLFIDSRGDIYAIDASNNTFAEDPLGNISQSDFFATNNELTNNRFQRYFAINDYPSEGYLIDNTQNTLGVDYTLNKSIYGVPLRNFARNEYTDVSTGGYNTFTLYSTGENKYVDDAKAFAIVYDQVNAKFRIGNVGSVDGHRNTNISFDTSTLQHIRPADFITKDVYLDKFYSAMDFQEHILPPDGVYWVDQGDDFWSAAISSPSGWAIYSEVHRTGDGPVLPIVDPMQQYDNIPSLTGVYNSHHRSAEVLTKTEKNVPALFAPNFTSSPAYFQNYVSNGNSILVQWNLNDFTSDPSVTGDLYFYRNPSTARTYNLKDISINSPMVFHNVEPTGSLTVTDLDVNAVYGYHMELKSGGWIRSSDKIKAVSSASSFFLYTSTPTLNTIYSGTTFNVDISVFVPTTWTVSTTDAWIQLGGSLSGTGTNPTGTAFTFTAQVYNWTGTSNRTGTIKLKAPGVPDTNITLTQTFESITVAFNSTGALVFTPALVDQNVTVGVKLYAWARVHGSNLDRVYSKTNTKIYNNGTQMSNAEIEVSAKNSEITGDTSTNYTIQNILFNSIIQGGVAGYDADNGPTCSTTYGSGKYRDGIGWIQITSAYKNTGTGVLSIGTNKYWYFRHDYQNGCNDESGASSTLPTYP